MQNKSLKYRVYLFFASGFYSGFSPKAPGTVGSLLALALYYFFNPDIIAQIAVILLSFFIGLISSNELEKSHGKDPQIIVIDEFLGIFISLFYIELTNINLILAFIFFRFFDIIKPLGIKSLQKLNAGFGIMLDDILAGIYTTSLLHLIGIYL